jgi:uncharacterized protein (TIGR03790 family)
MHEFAMTAAGVAGATRFVGVIACLLMSSSLAPVPSEAGGGPQNVLVIVNGRSDSSVAIANTYQRVREIPEGNIFFLPTNNAAALYTTGAAADLRRTLSAALFRTNILWPALGYIRSAGLTNQIDYLVFSSDIPTRIDAQSETNASLGLMGSAVFAVTAMAAYADLVEPPNSASNMSSAALWYRGTTYVPGSASTESTNLTHAAAWGTAGKRYYVSTVLGWTDVFGNTVDEVTRSLARARQADGTRPSGTVYLDANGDIRGTTRSWQFASASNEIADLGVACTIISNNPSPYSLVNKPDVLGGMMGAAAPFVPAGSAFVPGSLVESLTSFSGILDYSGVGQFRMSQHIGVGVAGTSGTVSEPYAVSGKFPAARMHAHYARGCSMGEAFYLSVNQPYHLLVMGDPLCRPHAFVPTVTVTNLSENDVVTGTLEFGAWASTGSTNGIAGFELFLDGVLVPGFASNGVFNLDTTQIPDGWHEARVVAYEASAVRTQGACMVPFRVNNSGEQVLVDATNHVVAAEGPDVAIDVAPSGGSPATIEVRKGIRVLATVAGTGGTVSIPTSDLGAGRSVLRAVATMGSGAVRSAAVLVDVQAPADVTPPVLVDYRIYTGTNSSLRGLLRTKPVYRHQDWIFLDLRFSEPLGLTNQQLTVGPGTSAPFPLQWNGMASTNRLPDLNSTTNPVVWRYQVSDTRDPEGLVPVVIAMQDDAGHTTSVTNFIPTDYTPPVVTQMWVVPSIALPGQTVRVHAAVSEALATHPLARLGAVPTAPSFIDGTRYQYLVAAGAAPSTNRLFFTNVWDLAENTNDTFEWTDTFEGKSLGVNLTNDTRWISYGGGTYRMRGFVTNAVLPPGSTRSAVFSDIPGNTNQLYTFKFPGRRTCATAEFDVYLDDRNPTSNADFRVRNSQGTTSRREVELLLTQATPTTWRVGISGPSPLGTVYYTNDLPVQTWHRIGYANDVVKETFSIWLDGIALATDVPYTASYTNLPWVDGVNFYSASLDEDVYIDNLVVSDSSASLLVSEDSDGDGIPDAWELRYFEDLDRVSAEGDADGDGCGDRDEWLSGTHPGQPGSCLRTVQVGAGPPGTGIGSVVFDTVPGHVYEVQHSADLADWQAVSTNFADATPMTVDLGGAGTNGYWRLRVLP